LALKRGETRMVDRHVVPAAKPLRRAAVSR
jgi:hypothetical protein